MIFGLHSKMDIRNLIRNSLQMEGGEPDEREANKMKTELDEVAKPVEMVSESSIIIELDETP